MGAKVTPLDLLEVKIVQPDYFEDYRGYYCETYSVRTMRELGFEVTYNFLRTLTAE